MVSFFWAWELKGTYPQIFEKKNTGEEAKKLFAQAQELLEEILEQKLFICQAVVGLWPAHAIADDVELFSDLSKQKECWEILLCTTPAGYPQPGTILFI